MLYSWKKSFFHYFLKIKRFDLRLEKIFRMNTSGKNNIWWVIFNLNIVTFILLLLLFHLKYLFVKFSVIGIYFVALLTKDGSTRLSKTEFVILLVICTQVLHLKIFHNNWWIIVNTNMVLEAHVFCIKLSFCIKLVHFLLNNFSSL